MSTTQDRVLSTWKDVLAQLRRIETVWRGQPLSKRDHETYTEAILMCGMVLHDLSNQYGGCGSHRDHVLWCINATHTDVSDFANALSDVIVYLRNYHVGGAITYAGFKHQLCGSHPRIGMLVAPVKGALESFFADPSAATFTAPYAFFNFLTHLTLEDLDMVQELQDEYEANEERVRSLTYPSFLVSRLNDVMKEWLSGFKVDAETYRPHHGPGSVAEHTGTAAITKYRALCPDQMITTVFRMCASVDVTTYLPCDRAEVTTRTAKFVDVPKNMKTRRVISKEPATLMYYQSGLADQIDRYVRKHPVLSVHYDLHTQEAQRELALRASRTREFATVDLSAASDSISYELVKMVFRGTPLYPYLVALRSQSVLLPDGKVTGVAKYAPMGSALCFPVMSLLLACIVECTQRYVRSTTGFYQPVYRVYGDDIIVADQCLADLSVNLAFCGFTLNASKTYGGTTRFRESCGCDAYDGVDVTPMKIGRNYCSRQVHVRSAGLYQCIVDMANQCHIREYRLLRRWLIRKLIVDTGWLPLFSNTVDHGLISTEPTNHRAKRRWSKRYHRDEIRCAVPLSVQSPLGSLQWDATRRMYVEVEDTGSDGETIRYYEWLRLTENRQGDPLSDEYVVSPRIGSAGAYLSKQWIVDA